MTDKIVAPWPVRRLGEHLPKPVVDKLINCLADQHDPRPKSTEETWDLQVRTREVILAGIDKIQP